MNNRTLLCLSATVILLGAMTAALADVPPRMNFQATLLDSDGNPVTTTETIRFFIYDQPTGGEYKWFGMQNVTPDENGHFSVVLGEYEDIIDTVFNNPDRWLEFQVAGDPPMIPRVRLVSVGYAFRVSTVDGSTGGTISGDLTIQDDLHLNGSVQGDLRVTDKATIGPSHTNTGLYGFVAGLQNESLGDYSAVSGGQHNRARGYCAVVCGGGGDLDTDSNSAIGNYSAIGGGRSNVAEYHYTSIGGGLSNSAGREYSTVGGGQNNTAAEFYCTVSGGRNNSALWEYCTVAGGKYNTADHYFSSVGGGDSNYAAGYGSTIAGGAIDTASGDYSTVGGGVNNDATATASTVGGGSANAASNDYATISGGRYNDASGLYSTVGGGYGNDAAASYATIAGGHNGYVSHSHGAIGGGQGNRVEGLYSCIPGGEEDTVTGDYALAFGYGVYNPYNEGVIFYDGDNSGHLYVNRDRRDEGTLVLMMPLRVGTDTDNGNGAYLTGGGVWTNGSSRTFKENFQPLDSEELLAKIAALPVESWNYKGTNERHIGPVSEDFVAAFDVGASGADGDRDNKYLSHGDVAGVALAAIQALHAKNTKLEEQVAELQSLVRKLLAEKGQ